MRTALSTILFCLLSISLLAGGPVHIGAAPAWLANSHPDLQKKPVPRDISNGYYFEFLDLQTNLLNNTEYTHFIKNIVNESGVQNASEISVTFAPEFQQVVFHKLVILRDGTVLNQLQQQQIKVVQEETDAADFEYNGLKRAFITLKDIRKGDRIEVSWSVTGFNPVFSKKYADEFYFANATAVCNYSKTIITRPERKLFIRTLNNAPQPTRQLQNNVLVYRWDNPPIKTLESESTTPSWYIDDPMVYVSEYSDWKDVVDWGVGTFHNYKYPLPQDLIRKIDGWKERARGDMDVFGNLATRFVQNDIRYLGLEIGANTHRPHDPADVFRHRFGDCKDKALLLSVILQREGIPAYVALVSTTVRDRLTSIAPSPDFFDHAIVAIERSRGVYVFVDPTISSQRGELINLYVPAYGYALVLRDGEDRLQAVDPGFEYNYDVTENLDVRYHDTSRFTVSTVYAGGAADKVRGELAETSSKELENNYRKYYATLFEGIVLDGPILSTDDSVKNELKVDERYAIPQIWNTSEKGKRSFDFSVRLMSEYLPDPSSAPNGKPLALIYPRSIDYTLNINLPENWEFGSDELHIKNESYRFDFIPTVRLNFMSLHYTLKVLKDNIPAEELAKYRSDYKNIADRIFFRLYKKIGPGQTPSGDGLPSPAGPPAAGRAPLWQPGTGLHPCWPAIWLSLLFGLLFTGLFRYLNVRNADTLYAPGSGYPLGGWVVVLGVTIGLGLIVQLIIFALTGYYSGDNWQIVAAAGGNSLLYFYLGGMTLSLWGLAGTGALMYWFLLRRDIFPRMFVWYLGVLLGGHALLWLFSSFYGHGFPSVAKWTLFVGLVRICIYSAVWIPYVLISEQVKSTFLEVHK
ncbi:MAG TPA: DUF3857 domain-containing protein [Puia sp.]|nr:DUF3857 domain-containing protein [Puia sp.]